MKTLIKASLTLLCLATATGFAANSKEAAPQPTPAAKAAQAEIAYSKTHGTSDDYLHDEKLAGGRAVQSAVTVTMQNGSVKQNLTRIANQHGWQRVVWKSSNDFQWTGTTRIKAASLQDAFAQILAQYPLQAQFWQGNHVLAIVPRTLTGDIQ